LSALTDYGKGRLATLASQRDERKTMTPIDDELTNPVIIREDPDPRTPDEIDLDEWQAEWQATYRSLRADLNR